MSKKSTPEERRERRLANLAKGREIAKKNREERQRQIEAGTYVEPPKKSRRPRNLDRIVREILDDSSLIDKVVSNQPDYWQDLPHKNGGYIIGTVMMVKAMGGDIKAAEWIRKTGFGDKVLLETDNGFFEKSEFTIQVLPSKQIEGGTQEVLENDIKQIEK